MKTFRQSRRPPAGITPTTTNRPLLMPGNFWWSRFPFLWSAANLSAPALWCLMLVLYVDARCDRPLFWWSLPLTIAISNTCAVAHAISRHTAGACITHQDIGRTYLGMAVPLNVLSTLLLAWVSGALSDMIPLVAAMPITAALFILATPFLFSLASHGLASVVLPCLILAGSGELRSH